MYITTQWRVIVKLDAHSKVTEDEMSVTHWSRLEVTSATVDIVAVYTSVRNQYSMCHNIIPPRGLPASLMSWRSILYGGNIWSVCWSE